MKRIIIILTITIFSSGLVSASDVILELKGSYFSPSERAFRDIYGGGVMYGGEVVIGLWRNLELWLGGSYFSKKGEMTFTKEETKLKILPIGGGLRYSYAIHKIVDIYGGLGVNYFSYSEETPLEVISESDLGVTVKAGGLIRVTKGVIIDIFIDYSYCKVKPADYRINIGGFEAGIGLGYEF